MKRIIYLLSVAFLFSQCSKKAADGLDGKKIGDAMPTKEAFRSKAPGAAPAKPINLGEYSNFTLANGLQVIVVENHKLPRVSYQISLANDPVQEGSQAGYVSLAGDLITKGTTTKSKAKIDEEVDFIGATLNSSPNGIFASSLKKHSGKLLDLMTDVLFNPTFPKEEFDKVKQKTLSGLASAKTDANSIASNVSSVINYGKDHPYGEVQTEKTTNEIALENCTKYFDTYFRPNNAYLVIVGDITPAEAKKQVEQKFSSWEKGVIPATSYSTVVKKPSGANVAFADKPGAVQSVINVTYPVDLKIGTTEELAANVMNNILGGGIFSGRLMQNLREKKAYTYGARSSLSSDKLVGNFNAFASVRNAVTDSSVQEFLYEMNRITAEPVAETDLQLAKNSMAGSFARSLESPQTIAGFALNTFKYNLPKDFYNTYLARLEKVNIADVQNIAKKYITPSNANILVIGNKDEVAQKLLRFDTDKKIDYYDAFGEVLKMDNISIPDGLKGTDVVENYLDAIGGVKAINSIKSLVTNATMSLMGQDATIVKKQVMPDKSLTKISLGAMVLQDQKFDGKKSYMSGMGRQPKTSMPGDKEFEEAKEDINIIDEVNYLQTSHKVELKGGEDVEGVKCYKVIVTEPDSKLVTQFYEIKTSLLKKAIVTVGEGEKTANIETEYKDYKAVNGLMLPHEIIISGQGPMPMIMKVSSYEANVNIDASEFEIK